METIQLIISWFILSVTVFRGIIFGFEIIAYAIFKKPYPVHFTLGYILIFLSIVGIFTAHLWK